MRIALVAQGGADRSGRERVTPALLWLLERLARRHQVHVFQLRHNSEPCTYPLLGAAVHDLGGFHLPAPSSLTLLRRLTAAMRAHAPFDVVHAYMAAPPGLLAVLAARRLDVPALVSVDGGELVALPDIGYGLQATWRGRLGVAIALRLARRVTVCTQAMAAAVRRRGVVAETIPLGVDTDLFNPAAAAVGGPPWRLLQVANLNRVKDQQLLLEAMRRVVDFRTGVHLDVVGKDTLDGATQRRCAELGLDAHVMFHDFLPSEAVVGFCRRAHVYVQSSRHEAAGVAVLEAAACGVPAVGTAVGYVAEAAPEWAVSVPLGDPEALARAIVGLLDDAPRRADMGRAALAWARAHDADWSAARFEELYEQLREA